MNENIKVGSDVIVDNTVKWIKDNPCAYQDDIYQIATEVYEHMVIHDFVSVQPKPYTKHNVGHIIKLEIMKPLLGNNVDSLSRQMKNHTVQTSDKLVLNLPHYKSGNPEELEAIISEVRTSIEERVLDCLYAIAIPDETNINAVGFSFLELDKANDVYQKLISEAKLIGVRCRQGNANFAILSPMALTALQCSTIGGKSVYARSNVIGECKSYIKMCGTVTSDDGLKINIYCNQFANGVRDGILLGYMGTTQVDSPITYVPLLTSMLVLDDVGTLSVSVNDGMHIGFSDDAMCSVADYFSFIGMNVL